MTHVLDSDSEKSDSAVEVQSQELGLSESADSSLPSCSGKSDGCLELLPTDVELEVDMREIEFYPREM